MSPLLGRFDEAHHMIAMMARPVALRRAVTLFLQLEEIAKNNPVPIVMTPSSALRFIEAFLVFSPAPDEGLRAIADMVGMVRDECEKHKILWDELRPLMEAQRLKKMKVTT